MSYASKAACLREHRQTVVERARGEMERCERDNGGELDPQANRVWRESMQELRDIDGELAELDRLADEERDNAATADAWAGIDRTKGKFSDEPGHRNGGNGADGRDLWLPSYRSYVHRRDVTTTNNDSIVPLDQARTFHDRLRDQSVLLSAQPQPQIVDMESDELHLPKLSGSVNVAWSSENTAISTSSPATDAISLKPAKLAALVQVSNEAMDDSNPSARRVVQHDLEREFSLSLDKGLLTGSGADPEPTGIANAPEANAVDISGDMTLDEFAKALERLDDANARGPWAAFMSTAQWHAIAQSKDSNGQYYLSPNPSNQRRQQLWGVPVYTTGHLGNTVLLVDASELLVGRRVAIRLEMSREYAFDQDATMIRVVGRYDVAVGNSGAVQRINTNVA